MTMGRALARAVVDEWVRCGIGHACLSPGSRSTPLVLELDERPEISLHVILDERSAGFRAVGLARASNRAAIVVTTSGSAAANLHPAVMEAHMGRVPLLVVTADRPPELRATGANQTMDQLKLFGDSVRWFCEVGVADDHAGAPAYWRSLACQAAARAEGSPAGPVHLNIAFREPLHLEQGGTEGGRLSGDPWLGFGGGRRIASDDEVDRLSQKLAAAQRPLVVAGGGAPGTEAAAELAELIQAPLVADALSNARRADTIVTYEALLRNARFAAGSKPDLVVRVGAMGLSKMLAGWLRDVPEIVVDRDGWVLDPNRSARALIAADPPALVEALGGASASTGRGDEWCTRWRDADRAARNALVEAFDDRELSEPRVAHELVAALPDGAALVVGASMPLRDVEWFSFPRPSVRFFANRGLNGIDGFVSTAVGVAQGLGRPTYALTGDLSFLHDSNGLHLGTEKVDLTIVVVNNGGGGIFSFLPQEDSSPRFEHLFATPHGLDLGAVGRAYGWEHLSVTDPGDLGAVLEGAGRRVVEVRTERARNVEVHRDLLERMAGAAG